MTFRAVLLGAAVFTSLLAVRDAGATTVLAFGQNSTSPTVTASDPTASTTTISALDVPITITSILAGGTAPLQAFFTLSATSTDYATYDATITGSYYERFDGTFSIRSAAAGGGTNYLSGSFQDVTGALGSSATLRSTTPNQLVSFTSDTIPISSLSDPKALALSFTDVNPAINGLCGPAGAQTLCGFTASVSGVFSANAAAVPEPASFAILGGTLLSAGVVRRKRTLA